MAGAKKALRGIDVNRLIRQGLDEGVQSIDKEAVKSEAKQHVKRVKRELKRKVSNSLPGRAAKKTKRTVAYVPKTILRKKRDIFG